MNNNAVYITNIASFLPNQPIENQQMETILGQAGNKPSRARRTVLRSNGITQRHYAIDPNTLKNNYNNADLTAESVRKLEDDTFSLTDIDCLVCGTSIADQLMPNHAVMVQGELGLQACETVATSGVCLSGVSALKYAYMGIRSGLHNHAVATGSELASASMAAHNFSEEMKHGDDAITKNPELAFDKDFLRWMLSDGAGAVLLQSAPRTHSLSLRIEWIDILSYAGEMPTCMYAGAEKQQDGSIKGWRQFEQTQLQQLSIMSVKQDVKLLNEHIIEYTVEKPLAEIIEDRQLTAENIDFFVPHYSSNFFRDKVYEGMKVAGLDIPQQRWFTNLSTKGNTGSASIYIMLEELLHSGKLQKNQKILCYIPESGRFSTSFILLTVV